MEGVAVKVTEVPAQTGLADGAMVTVAGVVGLTLIKTVFELAGLPVAQVAFEVTRQYTASPLLGVYVYVELPFTKADEFTLHR